MLSKEQLVKLEHRNILKILVEFITEEHFEEISDQDFKLVCSLLDSDGVTFEMLDKDISIGVDNGYSADYQLAAMIALLSRNKKA